MTDEEFIRDCARRNLSRRETRLTLGWTEYQFKMILDALPDVVWPARGCSLGAKLAAAARRDIPEQNLAMARAALRQRAMRTVRGVTGTIEELAKHFGVISPRAARARISSGMDLESALTTAAQNGRNLLRKPDARRSA